MAAQCQWTARTEADGNVRKQIIGQKEILIWCEPERNSDAVTFNKYDLNSPPDYYSKFIHNYIHPPYKQSISENGTML